MELPTKSHLFLLLLVTLSNTYSLLSAYHWSNKFEYTKNQASSSGGSPEATLSSGITLNSDSAFLSSGSTDQTITATGAFGTEYTAISIVNLPASANAKFFFIAACFCMEITNGDTFLTYGSTTSGFTFDIPFPTGKIIIRLLDCFLF
jgi:hypothetical protein